MGAGINDWRGKFKIPEEEYDAFLTLIHDHVFTKGKACSLLERHKAQSPVLIDLDFRYPAGGPLTRRFTTEQIRDFVAAYADAIGHFFLPISEPLQFFVQLKPSPEADPAHDAHKDGVHIVCPTLTTTPEIQYAIRGHLLQTGAIDRIFGATGMINQAQDVLDLSVIQRNNWFLYGACKPDKAWYKMDTVYSVILPEVAETITVEHLSEESLDTWSSLDLIKLLSLQHGHSDATKLVFRTEDGGSEWAQLVHRWGKGANWAKAKSPGFTSATAATAPTELSLDGSAGSMEEAMVQVSGISVRAGYKKEDIALAFKLVRDCLSPVKRAKGYHDWVALGLLLHNIAASDESLNVWGEFSRRVPGCAKTPDSIYKDKWALLPAEASALQRGRKPLMMGTLHLWAKEDSSATYAEILKETNIQMARTNDTGSHVSIAEQVIRMYRHDYRCTPSKKGATAASMDWYQFDGHTWHGLKTSMTLRSQLSNEVRNVYILANNEVRKLLTQTPNEDERQRLEAKSKNLLKIETQLHNSGFKDSVMKETAEKFYDEDFLQHMNQDPTLVGFSNGVLELRHAGDDGAPHVHFRPGRPDDCISFQMGRGQVGLDAIPYLPYNPAAPAPEHLEVLDFFTKIYPDPILREYALTLFAACLEGANKEQKFYIMSGSGGNGKSKIIDLMSKTFGEYQESLPVTALTRKRADAGSANPELIVLKCKRFVSMVEPEEGERINTSLMKQLSGEDTLKARGLFQDQDQFVVMARIFMSCNDLPGVSSMDNGTWRRLRVIPHVATFVEPGKPTDSAAHIHSRDPLLDSKINRWRPYLAAILVWYYETKYLRGGLTEPVQVTAASMKYKEENDSFAAFCQECLIKEAGAEVKANDVLGRYKEWCRFNPGKKVLQRSAIISKMSELYGKPVDAAGRIFAGIRLAEEGEDLSGNAV
jgi:P4 family phage/plasmid primase-like protien